MADILEFKRPARRNGNSLCRHNHHKWETVKDARFDVKQGRLVTVLRCERCGLTRVKTS